MDSRDPSDSVGVNSFGKYSRNIDPSHSAVWYSKDRNVGY